MPSWPEQPSRATSRKRRLNGWGAGGCWVGWRSTDLIRATQGVRAAFSPVPAQIVRQTLVERAVVSTVHAADHETGFHWNPVIRGLDI